MVEKTDEHENIIEMQFVHSKMELQSWVNEEKRQQQNVKRFGPCVLKTKIDEFEWNNGWDWNFNEE